MTTFPLTVATIHMQIEIALKSKGVKSVHSICKLLFNVKKINGSLSLSAATKWHLIGRPEVPICCDNSCGCECASHWLFPLAANVAAQQWCHRCQGANQTAGGTADTSDVLCAVHSLLALWPLLLHGGRPQYRHLRTWRLFSVHFHFKGS